MGCWPELGGVPSRPWFISLLSCVEPEWLCVTCAFHPMLGFKRANQAKSIAHGCDSTLVHLLREQENKDNLQQTGHWWKHLDSRNDAYRTSDAYLKPDVEAPCGDCFFVKGRKCTFSRHVLGNIKPALRDETISALDKIYEFCGQPQTHVPPHQ